jgi:invasion protein IalB
MTRLPLALPALCLALAVHVPAHAQQGGQTAAPRAAQRPAAAPAQAPGGGSATLVATFNDWSAYTAQTGRSKICYALSQPKARAPANLKDTAAYLFVSFRPAENVRNEVATVLGFATKDGGDAAVTVGSTSYALVTKAQNAWIKNPAEEAQAIATMSRGQTMVVSATSARGNKTSDRYSLAGFAQALDRAKKECP